MRLIWALLVLSVVAAGPVTSKVPAKKTAKPDTSRSAPAAPPVTRVIVRPETVRVIPSAIVIERREPGALSIWSIVIALGGLTLSIIVTVRQWLTSRVNLVFKVQANAISVTETGSIMPHVVFNATNRGARTTTLTGTIYFRRFSSRSKALAEKSIDGKTLYVTSRRVHQGFPFELATGKNWVALMEQEGQFDEIMRSPVVYAYLAHSDSDKPAKTRVKINPRASGA